MTFSVPSLEEFQNWPTERVAEVVRAHGPKVCVFPINGTRRWFMLEYPEEAQSNFAQNYIETAGKAHIKLYKMFFDHGVSTLLTPIIGPDILERGGDYSKIIEQGLLWFTQDARFLDFYDAYDVRVRVYGDTDRWLTGTSYESAIEAYNNLTDRTLKHNAHRLFFGVCAHDAAETISEIIVDFYKQRGHSPNKKQMIESYYGECVGPVDFFIGFNRLSVFDMPLIATGREDLYFTVCPSLYLDVCALRSILFDHIYSRRIEEDNVGTLGQGDWESLKEFYDLNQGHVLGVGRKSKSGAFWYPLPQVVLPND